MRRRKRSTQSERCGFEKDQSNLKDWASMNCGERAVTDGEVIPMTIVELHQLDQLVLTKGRSPLLRGALRQLWLKKAGPLNLENAGSGPVRIVPRCTTKVRCYFEALQEIGASSRFFKDRCRSEALRKVRRDLEALQKNRRRVDVRQRSMRFRTRSVQSERSGFEKEPVLATSKHNGPALEPCSGSSKEFRLPS